MKKMEPISLVPLCSYMPLPQKTARLLADRGYRICQLDTVIVAEEPKLWPHIPKMREKISANRVAVEVVVRYLGERMQQTSRIFDIGRQAGSVATMLLAGRRRGALKGLIGAGSLISAGLALYRLLRRRHD